MPLNSRLRATIWQIVEKRASLAVGVVWAGASALLVSAPWFGSGYLFGTDWPGPRRLDFPVVLTSSAPLEAALAAVSHVATAEWTGKAFIVLTLFATAFTAYVAAPAQGFVARAAASTIYVLNPFVYGRLYYGQWYLLAGYAAMPWAFVSVRRLCERPGPRTAVRCAVALTVIGILSLHLFVVMAVATGVVTLSSWLNSDEKAAYGRKLSLPMGLAAGLTLAASSYWLVPVLLGCGLEGAKIAGIGQGDLYAFATVPDAQLGLLPNILGLYGFWAEDSGRFTSMKAFAPIWPAVLVGILLLVIAGAVWGLRQRGPVRPWVVALVASALIGIAFEMGVSNPLAAGLVTWVDAHFVPYRGMRDAGKWAALLALVYSQLIALGVAATQARIRERVRPNRRAEWLGAFAAAILLALPTYYGNGLLFGMHGEIKPSAYPSGWYQADRLLAADPRPGRTLFLPWHMYMDYSFVRNENPVIVSPAPSFFSVPILTSADAEVPGLSPPVNPDQRAIAALVSAGAKGGWADVLATYDIKYIVLAREVDWQAYGYLDHQPGLVRIADFGSVVVYRNEVVP